MNLISLFLFLFFLLVGCERAQKKESSTLKFRIDLASLQTKKLQSQSMVELPSDKKLCFGVNILGEGIETKTDSCQPKLGMTGGFVVSGETIELEVPKGRGRQVELYLLILPTDKTCPNVDDKKSIDPKLLYKVATSNDVDMSKNVTEITMLIDYQGPGTDVATVGGFPASCLSNNSPGTPGSNAPGFTIGTNAQRAKTASDIQLRAQFGSAIGRGQPAQTPSGVRFYVE